MDESKKKQEVRKINTELLQKLQDLETDVVFSTGEFFALFGMELGKVQFKCVQHIVLCSFPSLTLSYSLSLALCVTFAGPEFGAEEDCIFVGMVAEDVDVPEVVDTIATLGRDIEESGRVILRIHLHDSPGCMKIYVKSIK